MRPRARPALDEGYFKRIAAIEFAVKNDDGLGRSLAAADVVLVGVSRTSKTPLSIYLGYLGWKATNVPLVKGIEPPAELFEIDPARIVGLTIDANRLAEIRSERIVLMGGDRRYADLNEVYEDLEHAAAIHKRLGCPVIDVSELSIEEIALRIVQHGRGPARGKRSGEAEAAGLEARAGRSGTSCSASALVVFYGLFTPFWFALRSLAWLAEFRAREEKVSRAPPRGKNQAMSGAARFVYDFDESAPGGRELLGGKGIGLAEMTALGLPVPSGFTITTDACRAYMAAGDLPGGPRRTRSPSTSRRLEEKTGKRFGDHADPLLVSVRSGAAISMPGMMDTILNLGLNDEAVEGLADRTGNRRFAYDSYRRLIQMFGEVVDGIDAPPLRGRADRAEAGARRRARHRPHRRRPRGPRRDVPRASTATRRAPTSRRRRPSS